MDRTAAVAFLTSEYTETATAAKFTGDQITTAYGTAVDMSLRQISNAGVQSFDDLSTAIVDSVHDLDYIALMNYYALKRFVRLFSLQFDVAVGSGAVDAKRSQIFKQMQSLLEDAEQECLKLGFNLGGGQSFQMGYLDLDFNESGWKGLEFGDFFGF